MARDALTVADLDTPVPVVQLPVLQRNLLGMASAMQEAGAALRPHIKTHKIPAIAHMQVALGARGITAATLGEAEVMIRSGLTDVLVAYPIVGSRKIERLLDLQREARVASTLDTLAVAVGLSEAARRRGQVAEVLIEVDCGLRRCGLEPGRELVTLAERVAALPGLRLTGLLTHGGHARNVQRREEIAAVGRREGETIVAAAAALRAAGLPVEVVSVGSTPTARTAAQVQGVTEARPGTYVFNEAALVALGIAREEDCALRVISTVVGMPAPDRLIIDAGSKTLTTEQPARAFLSGFGRILGHPELTLAALYEEHGVVAVAGETALSVGDRLEIIPNHVCPVVNLHDELTGVCDGRVAVIWRVAARGMTR